MAAPAAEMIVQMVAHTVPIAAVIPATGTPSLINPAVKRKALIVLMTSEAAVNSVPETPFVGFVIVWKRS